MNTQDVAAVGGLTTPLGSAHEPIFRTIGPLMLRNAKKVLRVPQLLTFSLAMPLMMLALFSQVFRSVEDTPTFPAGVSYIDYLVPAVLAASVIMNASNSGVGIALDLTSGMVDRMRSLPIRGWSVLTARSLSEAAMSLVQIGVGFLAASFVLGFSFHGTAAESLLAVVLLVAFGWSFTWIFQLIGTWVRDPESTQMSAMLLMMPLLFLSNAFVPVESMPRWLQPVADANPLSVTVEAVRGLTLGLGSSVDILQAVVATVLVAAIGSVAATTAFKRSQERG